MSRETQYGVVDRIEEGWAIIYLQGQTDPISFERSQLPAQIKEGDYIQMDIGDDKVIHVMIDEESTLAARVRVQAKVERLRRGEHLHPDKLADKGENHLSDNEE